ncbi:Altered inheritance of mitochondria protein 9 [Diaporthe eres]|nr:Altered inheritance of mitochondria protein 9 [Diaporthe eres]
MTSFQYSFDPHEYTSGCWLRADAAQRDARRVRFDFATLCQKAIDSSPGAKKVLQGVKVEGNFNRAFILDLDNGSRVVARIPFPVAGPSRLVTNSEVATIAYVRENTSIPVPKVLDWSDDPTNPSGTEYIIMEYAPGVQLHEIWPQMDSLQHMQCVQDLTLLVKELHDLTFPAYGSIYFDNDFIDTTHRIPLNSNFFIGPHCSSRYFPCYPGDQRSYGRRPPNQGPWNTFDEFRRGLVDAGISRVPCEDPPARADFRGSVEANLELIARGAAVLECLSRDPRIENLSTPLLLHPDLHKRNIFVDPENPTSITAESESDGDQSPEETARRDTSAKDMAICRQTWDVGLKGWAPRLYAAQNSDETLTRPFRYCYSCWKDGVAGFRNELVELCQKWSELGLDGSPPYQLTAEELAEHTRQWSDFQDAVNLRNGISQGLNTNEEGWVPVEKCETAKQAAAELLEQWLAKARDDGMEMEKAKQLWPFDC